MNAASLLRRLSIGAVPLLLLAPAVRTASDGPPPPPVPVASRAPRGTVATEIAAGVARGDTSCPDTDLVTFESCLLYQNALGTWYGLDMPHRCPHTTVPHPLASGRTPANRDTGGFDAPMTAADVLRSASSPCFAYLYAIAVTNLVPVMVNAANRMFQSSMGAALDEPGADPERCLTVRHGVCGNQTAVAIALLERAGLASRPVQFFYSNGRQRLNHVTPEVFIDGTWRLIDTTYGGYWIDDGGSGEFRLASTSSVVRSGRPADYGHAALLPFGVVEAASGLERYEFLMRKPAILHDGEGAVPIDLSAPRGTEHFVSIPDFIGDNVTDGDSTGTSFALTGTAGRRIRVDVVVAAASAVPGPAQFDICVGTSCQAWIDGVDTYSFTSTAPDRLILRTPYDVGYLVLDSLTWSAAA